MINRQYKQLGIILILSVALLMGCSGQTDQGQKEESGTQPTSAEKEEGLSLTTAQMRTVGISIGPVEQKNLNAVVKATGQLAVPPQNKAAISVLSGGTIRNINVIEGQQVKKGQVLAIIENQDLIRMQQEYLAAVSNFSYVKAEYARQQELKAAGAGTGKSFQSAAASLEAERSRIKGFEVQLRQLGVQPSLIAGGRIVSNFPLIAPISGTIGQITANMGAYVQPGVAIMEVVDNSKIHCDLIVFEKDLMKVKAGQRVNFQLTNQDNQQISGLISGINKSFENESKGVVVHAVIENTARQNLIPGMYVTALISVGEQLAAAVPVDAVVRAEGREYVFIVDRQEKDYLYFKQAEVKTGLSELGFTQITPLSPLPEKVSVVQKGAFYLQSKSAGGAEE